MNLTFKRALLPSLLATTLVGGSLVPAQPASAGEHIIRDIAVGAGGSVVSGAVRNRGSVWQNAVKGAAAGAAVNAVHSTRKHPKNKKYRNLGQDVGVGAAASTVTGIILHGKKDVLGDAVDGAAAGAAIYGIGNGKR